MKFILGYDQEPYGLERELVNSGYLTEADCLVRYNACNRSEFIDPQSTDCVLMLVLGDELAAMSDVYTMLELAMHGRISNLMVITSIDLVNPSVFTISDRWECGRFEELLSTGQLIICNIQQDWRSPMIQFVKRAKGG